jgi:hypothetical protein
MFVILRGVSLEVDTSLFTATAQLQAALLTSVELLIAIRPRNTTAVTG